MVLSKITIKMLLGSFTKRKTKKYYEQDSIYSISGVETNHLQDFKIY